MAHAPLNRVLRHIRKLAAGKDFGQATDQELLHRFATLHEGFAFEVLVERHGPAVLGLCRRLLHHEQDAEDVFQATFLTLARNAASIRKPAALGCWLYGVASRLAIKMRASAATRPNLEPTEIIQQSASPLAELTARELCAALDEELSRLSARYQQPLILCYLEGKTRDEAAKQLGCSLATLKRRLEQGRARLRDRLLRRGISLSAALAAVGLAQANAPAAVLLDATVTAAMAHQVGGSLSAGLVSERVVALVNVVAGGTSLMKAKLAAALIAACCVFAAGSGAFLARGLLGASSKLPPTEDKKADIQQTHLPLSAERTHPAIQPKLDGGPAETSHGAATRYVFTTLDAPGADGTQPSGINNKGQIVGYCSHAGGSFSFLWNIGNYTILKVPGSVRTLAYGINDSGQVVGSYTIRQPPPGIGVKSYSLPGIASALVQAKGGHGPVRMNAHSFLWSNGNYTMVDDFPNSRDTGARGINNAGQIVGEYSPGQIGFLRSRGGYTTIKPPGATGGVSACGINECGQIVGGFFGRNPTGKDGLHSYLLSAGKYTILDGPGFRDTLAFGINNRSEIVGGDGGRKAFLFKDGRFLTLTVPGAEATSATGINDAGQIIGVFHDKRGVHGFIATPTS